MASFDRRDGSPRGTRHTIQVRDPEIEARRDHSRFVLRDQGRVLVIARHGAD